jgi:hypothetical protein
MIFFVKVDIATNPARVRIFRAKAQVLKATGGAELVEQFFFFWRDLLVIDHRNTDYCG